MKLKKINWRIKFEKKKAPAGLEDMDSGKGVR